MVALQSCFTDLPEVKVHLKSRSNAYKPYSCLVFRSARIGVVVDNQFLVNGFENLRIIDASVLNQVTRMNPFITLAALGRYAGLLLNENDEPLPPPPV